MALSAGTRLGPYEIQSALGAGGMGEVYKARDTRLERTVAVKILPGELASDPERRARFEREARAIAALSHPHICVVHDVGREGDADYLVMEYLEGETLAARLARQSGPLPIDQVLRIGGELADALDKAHRAGVVHRDLKPANIILTRSGVKLLDFGLAKLKAPVAGLSMTTMDPTTRGRDPATAIGTVLGTAHYMAPEQVEGGEADGRSDIWALGVVLYEMATGVRPFTGGSPASLMSAILKDTPAPIASRQPLAPSALDHVVERCLDKDPDERWQSAGDIRRELGWIARASSTFTSPSVSAAPPAASGHRLTSRRWAVVAAAIAGMAAGLFGGGLVPRAGAPGNPADVVRFEVLPPPEATWSPSLVAFTTQVALSPDGTHLAFVAGKKGESRRIWVRPLDRVDAQPVPGTDGAYLPFWSPDGRFLAFFAEGKLKRVDIAGGAPQTLCSIIGGRGGAWSSAGVIVFGGQPNSPLLQVSAQGGAVTPATAFDPAHEAVLHYWPQFLPDGRHFMYFERSTKPEFQGIYVKSLDSPETTHVMTSDLRGAYSQGHLLFVRDGLLFAQPFDDKTLHLSGDPVRLGEGVGYYTGSYGYAAFDVSTNGVLAYGPALSTSTVLQWFNRDGKFLSDGPRGAFTSPQLSPDQKSVAISVRDEQAASDIWVLDLARGIPSRATFDPSTDWFPIWTPNGASLIFGSTRAGATTMYLKGVNGGTESRIDHQASVGRTGAYPTDVSPDGSQVLFHVSTPGGYDIDSIALAPDSQPKDFQASAFNEVQGRFSPDGRWVAYASDESGRFEVYVRQFPSGMERTPISIDGGMQPEWKHDGKELFYLSRDRKLMAVPLTIGDKTISAGTPRPLFGVDVTEPIAPYPNDYAVSSDGQRFLVNSVAPEATRQPLTVLLNWPSALKK